MASWTIAYRDALNRGVKPYLFLHLVGLNGRDGPVLGLVDSGADLTSMSLGYAPLMGYTAETLNPMDVGCANGSTTTAYRALKPVNATVPGIPDVAFPITPTFVPGTDVPTLWGRDDFFLTFSVLFDEANQQFSLSR